MSIVPLTKSYLNKKYKLLGFEQEVNKITHLPIKLTNVHYTFANAIRRVCTAEIPVLAIDRDQIKIEVTSQYHRDVLLDRFGFLVLDSNLLEAEDLKDLVFLLCDPDDPKKPLKNNTQSILLVTAHKHLIINRDSTQTRLVTSQFVPNDAFLLTLLPGEEIHAVMSAEWGIMRKHARWQAGLVHLKYETAQDATDELETNEQLMDFKKDENGEPTGFLLVIESFGRLNANKIILEGLETLKKKFLTFKTQILLYNQSEKADKLIVDIDKNVTKLKILDEDHTLGTVLENYALRKLKDFIKVTVADLPDKTELDLLLDSLCAYRKPHPLDTFIEFQLQTPKDPPLVFPVGHYDEIKDPPLRLILFTIDDMVSLCDQLTTQVKASLF